MSDDPTKNGDLINKGDPSNNCNSACGCNSTSDSEAESQDGSYVQWDADSKDGSWAAWPCCVGCGKRREAVCPRCENADDDIPLAEFIAPAAPQNATDSTTAAANLCDDVLLMCPHCDEAFAAEFYKNCTECGRDFGDGISHEDDFQLREPLNPRIMAVTVALGSLAVGLGIYFWLLLRTQ